MGATTFDFDADGDVEVVYADECFMRMYDGTSGEVLYSHWRPSRTASEVPIVVGSGDGADTVIAIGLHTASSCTQATGVGGVPAYDPQFQGLGCVSDLDCYGPAGSCRAGRCRCTADTECCAPGTDCASVGFACHPSEDAEGNTCRAVRVPDASAFARYGVALNQRALVEHRAGRYESSARGFESALELEPSYGPCCDNPETSPCGDTCAVDSDCATGFHCDGDSCTADCFYRARDGSGCSEREVCTDRGRCQ